HFADGKQTAQTASAVNIGSNSATLVMRRRHHWNGLPAHVDSELQTSLENVREPFPQKRLGLVRDIEVNALRAAALDLSVNRTRHHIARSQRTARVISPHEIPATVVPQSPAFATDGFGNQKSTLLGRKQAGRMQLTDPQVC